MDGTTEARRPITFEDGSDDEVQLGVELPDAQKVILHLCGVSEFTSSAGVTYQRCGGGRRVIRKQGGSK